MSGVLIVVTLFSLAMAGALLAYVVRLRRQERDRSAARVAALAEQLDAGAPPTSDEAPGVAVVACTEENHVAPFLTTAAGPPASPRLLIVAAVGILGVGLAVAGIRVAAGPTDAATAAPPAPLELLSLRHEREGETLTVSGLVGNPDAGEPLNDVAAEVLTFDRDGNRLARGTGAADFRRLAPGDESPFVVRLPGAPDVTRYQVTFHAGSRSIGHVDRRSRASEALARGHTPRDARRKER